MSILKALADAEHNAVPEVRKRSVSVEREDVEVAAGARSSGTGYNEYAAVAVRTTRKESRGFDKERYVVKRRFSDFCGRRIASDSAPPLQAHLLHNRDRRRRRLHNQTQIGTVVLLALSSEP